MKDDVMVYSCRMDVEDDWLPSRWRFVVDLTLVELSVKKIFGWLFLSSAVRISTYVVFVSIKYMGEILG